eukprot:SAG11_NODE_226_length_12046_cov_14.694568_4_plen_252_part_00
MLPSPREFAAGTIPALTTESRALKSTEGGSVTSPKKKLKQTRSPRNRTVEDSTKGTSSGAAGPSDPTKSRRLVCKVRDFMRRNKLSQCQVSQITQISQAVISQWLRLKYRGNNEWVDEALAQWIGAPEGTAPESGFKRKSEDESVAVQEEASDNVSSASKNKRPKFAGSQLPSVFSDGKSDKISDCKGLAVDVARPGSPDSPSPFSELGFGPASSAPPHNSDTIKSDASGVGAALPACDGLAALMEAVAAQ